MVRLNDEVGRYDSVHLSSVYTSFSSYSPRTYAVDGEQLHYQTLHSDSSVQFLRLLALSDPINNFAAIGAANLRIRTPPQLMLNTPVTILLVKQKVLAA